MGQLVFNLSGSRSMVSDGECFLPLKSETYLTDLFNKHAVMSEDITSIFYKPRVNGFSRSAKKTIIRYYDELIDHNSIKDFIIRGTTGKAVFKGGVDLPPEISGSAIYIILSLFRYGVECPTMVMSAMEYAEVMDFDTALYLAHYTFYKEDTFLKQLPYTLQAYPQRPVNHSVLDPTRVYRNGSKFLSDTLPVIAGISSYKDTKGYGDIQGIMKVNNMELLEDFPAEVSSLDMAARLAEMVQ